MAVTIGLVACASPAKINDTPTPWITVATYVYDGSGGPDAGVIGVLANYEGCLVVKPNLPGSNPDQIVLVFFPEDDVSFPADGGVSLFGVTYHLGDTVTFGGGFGGSSRWTPPGCESANAQAGNFGETFTAWN